MTTRTRTLATLSFHLRWRAPYLVMAVMNLISGSLELSQLLGLDITKAARMRTIASQMVLSAKYRPGHILSTEGKPYINPLHK